MTEEPLTNIKTHLSWMAREGANVPKVSAEASSFISHVVTLANHPPSPFPSSSRTLDEETSEGLVDSDVTAVTVVSSAPKGDWNAVAVTNVEKHVRAPLRSFTSAANNTATKVYSDQAELAKGITAKNTSFAAYADVDEDDEFDEDEMERAIAIQEKKAVSKERAPLISYQRMGRDELLDLVRNHQLTELSQFALTITKEDLVGVAQGLEQIISALAANQSRTSRSNTEEVISLNSEGDRDDDPMEGVEAEDVTELSDPTPPFIPDSDKVPQLIDFANADDMSIHSSPPPLSVPAPSDDEDVQIMKVDYSSELSVNGAKRKLDDSNIVSIGDSDSDSDSDAIFDAVDQLTKKTRMEPPATPVRPNTYTGRLPLNESQSPQGVLLPASQLAQVRPLPTSKWTDKVYSVLRNQFHMKDFRGAQLEAIIATLEGKDVLILMPTGGGKSLCFQLPALVRDGVTIVVSPLVSLMDDQVEHLKERNIAAELYTGRMDASERSRVFDILLADKLKLLYVSPEMLAASNSLKNALHQLQARKMLGALVIDEAHSVSSWGHDFRPEYKRLQELKDEFSDVPIMALTATATERVKVDIVECLRKDNMISLKSSFNRPNLYYEVRPKTKDIFKVVKELCSEYRTGAGIVYCHSRKDCENVSAKLEGEGVRCDYYHAQRTNEERRDIQLRWQRGQLQVICATIAFGMGIDKANVRFVVHNTLSKTVEGYYQETGRAGRDGLPSKCILFYSRGDVASMRRMMFNEAREGTRSWTIAENNSALLTHMQQYCENSTDCRRKLMLAYFNENFDTKECHGTCQNCQLNSTCTRIAKDVNKEALVIVELVKSIQNAEVTTNHCAAVFRGERLKKVKDLGHFTNSRFGEGKSLDKGFVDRLFSHLLNEKFLLEYVVKHRTGLPQTYLKIGPRAPALLAGRVKVKELMVEEGQRIETARGGSRRKTTAGSSEVTGTDGLTGTTGGASSRKKRASRPSRKNGNSERQPGIPASSSSSPAVIDNSSPLQASRQPLAGLANLSQFFQPTPPGPRYSRNFANFDTSQGTLHLGSPMPMDRSTNSSIISPNPNANVSSNVNVEELYYSLEVARSRVAKSKGLRGPEEVCSDDQLRQLAQVYPFDLSTYTDIVGNDLHYPKFRLEAKNSV